MKYPIGTKFTKPDFASDQYWIIGKNRTLYYYYDLNKEPVEAGMADSPGGANWVGYTPQLPKESLFDKLYLRLK